jgi:outer membrane protein OmpA-like peptidoglycan-associated protein
VIFDTELRNPVSQAPSGTPQTTARGNAFLLVAIGLTVVAASVFVLVRLTRVERQIARLDDQIEQNNRALQRIGQASEAALSRASEAESNARMAAQQRDEARKAQATSEQNAEAARKQAESAQTEAIAAQQRAEEFRKQREDELNRLQQALSQIADTRRTAMGLIMTLGSNSIKFDFDKATLRPENREVLSRIAGVLTALKGYGIHVYGYADDRGSDEYNVRLSARRAAAVRDYLVKAGLNPAVITTKGYGKADPRAGGKSADSRAINRRVEIGIVDSSLRYQELPDDSSTSGK